jgi:glutamate formiminotransferase/formiminotetrahydrofolate cyclodeaminase
MKQKVVECIANYSEARRPEVIESIKDSIRSAAGVVLLDEHLDEDHNRTVLTFAGSPEAVEEAAFNSIKRAGELIDLDQHRGEHPRIGAADVVPLVPISGVSMQDCVASAERLGERVGRELNIPVYLYEEAARTPERKNLENIRRGEYEKLKEIIKTDPDRKPDFGPASIGSAGAVVIGARQPLIAFNVNLTTADIDIAKKVAVRVRHSSGGLRFVKALGMLVDGRAQVSMNITNFRKTPVHSVVEMIRREARRYGTAVHSSELVGLIPADALIESSRWYLQLDLFENDQILENRMAAVPGSSGAPSSELSPDQGFLEALSSAEPTPGGGAAAAYTAGIAASLILMVARLTIGKQKYAEVQDRMKEIEAQAERLRDHLNDLVGEDIAAFNLVMSAYGMPRETEVQKADRSARIEAALMAAAQVPLQVAREALDLMMLADELVLAGNVNAISDGGSAAELANAALQACLYNVRINLAGIRDSDEKHEMLQQMYQLQDQSGQVLNATRQNLTQRGGFSAE